MASVDDGRKVLDLILRSQQWIHRRVDKLDLTAAGETRRSVSLDATVPRKWAIVVGKGQVAVPLGWLEKGPLRGLDTEGPDGRSIPILSSSDNGELAASLFFAAATNLGLTDDNEEQSWAVARKLAFSRNESRDEAWQAYNDWLTPARSALLVPTGISDDVTELLDQLAETLISSFILFAVIGDDWLGRRAILKFSSSQDELKASSRTRGNALLYEVDIPDLGLARSQHLEVEAPEGTHIESLTLRLDSSSDVTSWISETQSRPRPLAHLNTTDADRFAQGTARFHVRPTRHGMQLVTDVAVIVISIGVIFSLFARFWEPSLLGSAFTIPSPAVPIMLTGPALLLSWVVVRSENRVALKALAPLRYLLVLGVAQIFLVAGLAAIPLSPWVWQVVWLAVYALCIVTITFWIRVRFLGPKLVVEE
ncbi:hypothetical protein [Paenarthrobacter sp. 2TAF44]|uniref:hypothetical protein n=1 Tax=Paenarthrobacter sp. 2TAF44 TaxID=3233018 RepID=UPI003F9AA46B